MRSALPLAALTIAAALLLSGCVPNEPEVVPPPEPTTEPVFASDEEALAAATDAYKAYLQMSDLIAQEGGANPERIAPYVTEEWLEKELHWSNEFAIRGWRLVGTQTVASTTLQQAFTDGGETRVVIYACVDLDRVTMRDAAGNDVTPVDLGSVLVQEVTMSLQQDGPLRLAGAETWAGGTVC